MNGIAKYLGIIGDFVTKVGLPGVISLVLLYFFLMQVPEMTKASNYATWTAQQSIEISKKVIDLEDRRGEEHKNLVAQHEAMMQYLTQGERRR
jgi:hypothetical protein